MVPLVYVAGPITSDPFGAVRNSLEAFRWLRRIGVAPFMPQWSVIADMVECFGYENWMTYDFDILGRCDALLRLPGDSKGADREVAHALALGLPVFEMNARDEFMLWVHEQHARPAT